MSRTGLVLRPVLPAIVAHTLNRGAEPAALSGVTCDLWVWQPDLVLMSVEDKKIALVDLSHPSDVNPGQLQAAGAQKLRKYSPLVEALIFLCRARMGGLCLSMGGWHPGNDKSLTDWGSPGVLGYTKETVGEEARFLEHEQLKAVSLLLMDGNHFSTIFRKLRTSTNLR